MNPPPQDQSLVFRQDRRKLLGVAVIGVVFVGMGVSFVAHPDFWRSSRHSAASIEVMGWVTTPFFSLCLAAIVVSLVRPATVKLGPEGITVSSAWRTYSRPWDAVTDFRLRRYKTNRTVVFNDASPPNRGLAGINRGLSGATSGLPTALNVAPEELLEAIEAGRARWYGNVRNERST
jgi:hypothetical protein